MQSSISRFRSLFFVARSECYFIKLSFFKTDLFNYSSDFNDVSSSCLSLTSLLSFYLWHLYKTFATYW